MDMLKMALSAMGIDASKLDLGALQLQLTQTVAALNATAHAIARIETNQRAIMAQIGLVPVAPAPLQPMQARPTGGEAGAPIRQPGNVGGTCESTTFAGTRSVSDMQMIGRINT